MSVLMVSEMEGVTSDCVKWKMCMPVLMVSEMEGVYASSDGV